MMHDGLEGKRRGGVCPIHTRAWSAIALIAGSYSMIQYFPEGAETLEQSGVIGTKGSDFR